MKKILSTIICMFVCVVYSYGQIYHYSSQTEDVYKKDNSCKIGEDYIKSKFVPNWWKYERHSAAVYNFPNKNKLVVINYSISYTEKQTLRSTNGNGFYTNKGWTNEVSKLKENSENVYHAVLIDSKGSPIKAIKVCNTFILTIFTNNSFLLMAGKEDGLDIIYTNVMCFKENGDDNWSVKSGGMIIYDYVFWKNSLYVVGERNGYSYYRIIDLLSGSIVDEANVSKDFIFTRIDIESDGISLVEKNYNNVRKYKIDLSTNILSGIQSAKSKEESLLKRNLDRKQYEDRTKSRFKKISEIIEGIDYFYNDYFRVLQLNPRFTAQQRNNWRDEKLNNIRNNLDYANKAFDEIIKLAEKYGLSEEIPIINAKKKALNKETGEKIRKMGGTYQDDATIHQDEGTIPICWQCKEKLTDKDFREGYHDGCGSRIFKCKRCGGRLITDASEVRSGKCKKCGKSIYD